MAYRSHFTGVTLFDDELGEGDPTIREDITTQQNALAVPKARIATAYIENHFYEFCSLIGQLKEGGYPKDSLLREYRVHKRKTFRPLYTPSRGTPISREGSAGNTNTARRTMHLRQASTGTLINIPDPNNSPKGAHAMSGATLRKLNAVADFKLPDSPARRAKTLLFKVDDKVALEEAQKMLEEKEQVTVMAAQLGQALLNQNDELEKERNELKSKVEAYEQRDDLMEELTNENSRLQMKCEFLQKQLLRSDDYTSMLIEQGESLTETLKTERANTKRVMGPMLTRQRSMIMTLNEHEELKGEVLKLHETKDSLTSELKKSGKSIRVLEAEIARLQNMPNDIGLSAEEASVLRARISQLLQRIKALESELVINQREEQTYKLAGISRQAASSALEILVNQCGYEEDHPVAVIDSADQWLSALRHCVNNGEQPSALAWLLANLKNKDGFTIGNKVMDLRQSSEKGRDRDPVSRIAAYVLVAVVALQLTRRSDSDNLPNTDQAVLYKKLEEAERNVLLMIKERDEKGNKILALEEELASAYYNHTRAEEELRRQISEHSATALRESEYLRVDRDSLISQVDHLKSDLAELTKDKASVEQRLQNENDNLKAALAECKLELEKLAVLKESVEKELREENFQLGSDWKSLTYELEEVRLESENERVRMAAAADGYTAELLRLTSELAILNAEKGELESSTVSLLSTNTQLVGEIKELHAREREWEELREENARLSKKLAEATSELAQLRIDMEGMERTVQSLREELSSDVVAEPTSTETPIVPRIAPPEPRAKDYVIEEEEPILRYINTTMKNDPHLWHVLPADPNNHIIQTVYDGVLFCKLINFAIPGTLDERVVNIIPLNSVDVEQNLNLCLNSARAIGCIITAASSSDLLQAQESISILYEIIKVELLSRISLAQHPELYRLKDSRESVVQIANLSPLKLLERWVAHHIQAEVNFEAPLKVLSILQCAELLHVLNPDTPTFQDEDAATHFFTQAHPSLSLLTSTTVLLNPRLQLLFLAQLLHFSSGLPPLSEADAAAVQSALEENSNDPEGSREERAFGMWINSLGAGSYVTNLQQDMRDGLVMLRILDKLQPGLVNWKEMNVNPNNPYKMLENCNASLAVGKKLNFSLVGIAGKDLFDGNRKLILAFVWQACKHHLLSVLRQCGGDRGDFTENDVLAWTKTKLQNTSRPPIASFRDPSFRTARPLIEVLAATAPGVVQWRNVIMEPRTDAECLMNARYAVGLARKIGCFVFCVPEDITDVKQKMIITFLASVMWYDITCQKSKRAPLS